MVGVRVAGSFVVLTEIISGQFTAKAQIVLKKTNQFLTPERNCNIRLVVCVNVGLS
jgi:hypothetical protein